MVKNCKQLEQLLDAEQKIIKRHLERHKYFQHIENDNIAMIDFVKKYGWLMREFYCGYVCGERRDCDLSKRYLKEKANGTE